MMLLAKINPVNPPKMKLKGKPIVKYKGVIKEKNVDQKVANQFSIFIPVGIAIMEVENVKYDRVSKSNPTIYM